VRVILKAEVRGLGRTGEIKDVADGYARNYLLPKGLAIEATGGELKVLAQERQSEKTKKDRAHQDAEELAKRLGEITLVFKLKAGEQGKTFGSVTANRFSPTGRLARPYSYAPGGQNTYGRYDRDYRYRNRRCCRRYYYRCTRRYHRRCARHFG